MSKPKMVDCDECTGRGFTPGFVPNWTDRSQPDKPCPWCGGVGKVEEEYVVTEHCASGWTELVGAWPTLAQAKREAEKEMKRSPVTECGTGGVVSCEVSGPNTLIGCDRVGDSIQWVEA